MFLSNKANNKFAHHRHGSTNVPVNLVDGAHVKNHVKSCVILQTTLLIIQLVSILFSFKLLSWAQGTTFFQNSTDFVSTVIFYITVDGISVVLLIILIVTAIKHHSLIILFMLITHCLMAYFGIALSLYCMTVLQIQTVDHMHSIGQLIVTVSKLIVNPLMIVKMIQLYKMLTEAHQLHYNDREVLI